MLSDRKVFMNGKFTAWEQAGIHMMSHSFSRGAAIFEVLSVHDIPETGPCVFRLDKHVQRLFSSASALGMVPGLSPESVQEAVCRTVRKNGIRQGAVKIMGYNPEIAFDILPSCNTLDIPVEEDRIPPELLETADEIFFTCTPMKVLPIKTCGQRALSPVPGPVTLQVADVMADVTTGRNPQFAAWLFPVS